MKKHLKRLKTSKAARNAFASYLAFVSTTVTGLISIPLAVHHLSREELGLWAVISAVGGYLAFMELGLGFATGRKMADGIVAKDKAEIDRWWTLSRVVLACQGVLVILIGLAFTPVLISVMVPDYPDKRQVWFLFTGIVFVQGIKLPFQGAEGILTAQERLHWVYLRQAIIFWVELVVFSILILSGFGLYSILWSKVGMFLAIWLLNWWLLSQSEPKLGWNWEGIRWDRFRSLFKFSFGVFGVGFLDVLVKSLPVMVMGKMGGLALVPLYTISIKASTVLVSLGKRNYQSFYPALQKMFIQGQRERFARKYADVGMLTVATGLGISGLILGLNRTAVEFLAKPEFYAGPVASAWFAVATITMPVSGLLQTPLLVAGKMGKSVAVAIIRAALAIGACILAFQYFGVPGLAAVMALLPLITVAYAYFRGAKETGIRPSKLSGLLVLLTLMSILLVVAGGALNQIFPSEPLNSIKLGGKTISLPSLSEAIIGGVILSSALLLFLHALKRLGREGQSGSTFFNDASSSLS